MNWFQHIRRLRWAHLGRKELKALVESKHKNNEAIKVILGAGHHSLTSGEWINTDLPQFDITEAEHWKYIFGEVRINNVLAEHVFEHLTLDETKIAFAFIHHHLKPKGIFRLAVPDGYHPDPTYIDYVKPNGNGPGCEDHKLLWNKDMIEHVFADSGLHIHALEYHTKAGELISHPLDPLNGNIIRTATAANKQNWELKNYTSLIVDFVKN